MKKVLLLLLFCAIIGNSFAQIRLVEVDPTSEFVSIKNFGVSSEDISSYRLCALFAYKTLSTMSVESGNLNLGAGETVIVSGWALNNSASDLGIYLATGSFGSASAMVDFTQWGAGGLGRESVAVSKGIWTAGDFIEENPPYNYSGDGTQNGLDFWQLVSNIETDIVSYSFAEQTGQATIDGVNHTVDIEVESGTDVTSLVASFDLSEGATSQVNAADQESGLTANNFSNPVTYTVTAEDGTTKQDWIIVVSEHQPPNTETDFLTYSLPEPVEPAVINAIDHTISIDVGNGTNVSSLIAIFTTSEGATVEIATTIQESGVTVNDFTNPVVYRITAEDGVTFQDWTVTLTIVPNEDTDIVGFSFNEQTKSAIINLVDHTVDVEVEPGTDITGLIANFELSFGAEAVVNAIIQISGTSVLDFTNPVTYTITAEDGTTTQDWLITVIFDPQTDFISFSFQEETGAKEINSIDHTIMIEVQFGTDLSALTAIFTLSDGAAAEIDGTQQVSGQTVNDFSGSITYTIISSGGINVQNWIVTLTFGPSFETDFLTYSLSDQTGPGIIDINEHTIMVEVPFGTDLTSLAGIFSLSDGATALVNSVNQESAVSTNDFTTPVTYLITAEDGVTMQEWIVTVTFGPNSATDFLTFSLPEETGLATINNVNHIIDVEVTFGTDLTSLVASFTLSEGASSSIGGILQESSVTANDFTTALIYTVTAQDGTTSQDWSVCTVVAPNSEANILEFSFDDETEAAIIDDSNSDVRVEVHSEADITDLIATFTLSEGARAEVNGVIQNSGIDSRDFSALVIYKIIAGDGITSRNWNIIVTKQEITAVVENTSLIEVVLYPNPVSEFLNVQIDNNYYGKVIIKFNDGNGKYLAREEFMKENRLFTKNLSLPITKGGIIMIEIILNENRTIKRLLKM